MPVKISNMPLELLIAYQKVIEMTSLQMRDFADNVEQDVTNGLVSRSYFDRLLTKLQEKVGFNNEVDEKMQTEVNKRLKNAFGSKISTPKTVLGLFEEYDKEKLSFAKIIEKRKEDRAKIESKHSKPDKPVKKLNTSVSSEKVIK